MVSSTSGPSIAGSAPIVASPSELTPDLAFACATRELATRQYTVATADPAAGLIKSERERPGATTEALPGRLYDELTVTIAAPEQPVLLKVRDTREMGRERPTRSSLRVTTATTEHAGGGQHASTNQSASKEVKADGNAITAACK